MADIENPVPVMDEAKVSSVGDAIRALIEDGQTLLEAEIAYRKAQAVFGLGEAKVIALLLVLGLAFGFFTLLALVVGLLLALAFYVGFAPCSRAFGRVRGTTIRSRTCRRGLPKAR